jgi:hypothetical protein
VISDFYCPGDEETRQVLKNALFFNFIAKPFDLAEISALAQRPLEQAYAA